RRGPESRYIDSLHAGLRLLVQCLAPADLLPLGEQARAGDVVELDTDAVGVLEKDRIIAGCPRFLLRPMDKAYVVGVLEEAIEPVDCPAVPEPEADVVQPGSALVEA